MDSSAPTPLPPEILVEDLFPEGRRYVLPPRDLGKARWLALPMIGGGVFIMLAGCFWGIDASRILKGVMHPFQLVFALLAIPGIVMAFIPLGIGLAMLKGHSEVEVCGDWLRTIERVGPFFWRRSRSRDLVRRLLVEQPRPKSKSHQQDPAISMIGDLTGIRIDWDGNKPWWAALGYPREMLVPLAHDLAAQCSLAEAPAFGAPAMADEPVEVVDGSDPESAVLVQPPESDIVMSEAEGMVAFNVPARGVLRGSGGLFVFACLWCGFMMLFTWGVVFADGGIRQKPLGEAVAISAFIGLFWMIGIGLMLAAIHLGRRRAGIVVAGDRLSVLQVGLFRSRESSWSRDELLAVQAGDSKMSVNDRPLPELKIMPHDGKPVSLLAGRDRDELEWLAAQVRKALGLSVTAMDDPLIVTDVARPPAETRVQYVPLGEGCMLSVPPHGLNGLTVGMWFFALFWNALMIGGVVVMLTAQGMDGLFPWLILSLMSLVGLAALPYALHLTIQRAELAVRNKRLSVVRSGLFGVKRNEWNRDELATICVGPSGIKTNNQPLMQLQIVPQAGKTLGMLTGRDARELAWIATVLRKALDLQAEESSEETPLVPTEEMP